MFDEITINAKNYFSRPGIIAESLLFYKKTNLIIDAGSMGMVIRYCGSDSLKELINSGELNLHYNSTSLGSGNVRDNIYMVSAFTTQKHKKEIAINNTINELFGRSVESKHLVRYFQKNIQEHNYSIEYQDQLSRELTSNNNLLTAIKIAGKGALIESDIQIENIEKLADGNFKIESNIDKEIIRKATYILCTSTGELYDSQVFKSAIVTNSKRSNYTENRLKKIFKARTKDEKQIQAFHEFILPEFVDLKGTMDSGNKNFQEYVEIWRKAKKFKAWLKEEEPNVELLTKYTRRIREKTWLDQLPLKNLRWLLFATLGTIAGGEIGGLTGTTVGLGIDYFDDLILNSILKDWKPDQFIEGEYKDFLNFRLQN